MKNSKVSIEERAKIITRVQAGEKVKDLAKEFGVTPPAIYQWMSKGKTKTKSTKKKLSRVPKTKTKSTQTKKWTSGLGELTQKEINTLVYEAGLIALRQALSQNFQTRITPIPTQVEERDMMF